MDKTKEIEAVAPPGSFSQYDISCMLPELERLEPEDVYLEIGVQYGRSLYVAAKYSKARVYGIDIEPTLCAHWLDGLNYTYSWKGSDAEAENWDLPISLLFIDGDHSYAGVKNDWNNFAKFVKPGGVVMFHDCDETSPGVVRLFEELKNNPEFTDFRVYKTANRNTSMTSCRRV